MVLEEDAVDIRKVDFRGVFNYVARGVGRSTPLSADADSTMRYFPKSNVLIMHPVKRKRTAERDDALIYMMGSDGRFPAISLSGKKMKMTTKNEALQNFRLERAYNPYNEDGYGSVYGTYGTGVKQIMSIPLLFMKEYTKKEKFSDALDCMEKNIGSRMPETSFRYYDGSYPDNLEDIIKQGKNLLKALDSLGDPIKTFDADSLDSCMKVFGFGRPVDKNRHRFYFSNNSKYCMELFSDMDMAEYEKDGKLFSKITPCFGYELISIPQWKPIYVRENVQVSMDDPTQSLKSSIRRDMEAYFKKSPMYG